MVRLDNLTVSYRQHPALHHISACFKPASLTAVMGPNGSGKSTLLKSIVGLLPTAGGSATVSVPRDQIAYLPQLTDIDRSFPISVRDCVLLGCWPEKGAWRGVGKKGLAQVDDALHSVALEGFENRPISSLSSGQFQRVLFARLLVQDASLILLDEPFNSIDSKTTHSLLALIQQWHQQKRCVIVVLHDEAQALAHFPQTLLLAREVVAWGATSEVLTDAHLTRARAMAEAWDEDAELCEIDSPATRSGLRVQAGQQRQVA